MVGLIIGLVLVLALVAILCLKAKLSDMSDCMNDLNLSDSEISSLYNVDPLELENTEYNWGHNVKHYHDEF